ncbi:hypothetical protein B0T13DRAFT_408736 [Neurospora crassa]|nr:hypothetical protein B0T13DRAFT_408751 [Neurospora crassa]KAK3485592.1 hypothetical protein B0T13DRAFT_408739 [Neurospora crassa]KAK3485599.1 hypothetical protein B0T13DRAFT_408736 [Neurospora crassa]
MALKYDGKEEEQACTFPSNLKASIIEENQQTSLHMTKSPQRFDQQRTLHQKNAQENPSTTTKSQSQKYL